MSNSGFPYDDYGIGQPVQKEGWQKPKPLTKVERFEKALKIPFEVNVGIGSTFFLLPSVDKNSYRMAFDWLWFHFGIDTQV